MFRKSSETITKLTESFALGLEAAAQQAWSEYLLQAGEGRTTGRGRGGDGNILQIKPEMLTSPNTIQGLLSEIYGDLQQLYYHPHYLTGRAILAPKNVDVEKINNQVINMMPGEVYSPYQSNCD